MNTPARCEPPEELREHRAHWVFRNGSGKVPWRWNNVTSMWLTWFALMSPERAAEKGYSYYAPLPDPPLEPVTTS